MAEEREKEEMNGKIPSLTITEGGLVIVSNDMENQVSHVLELSWKEVAELAAKRGTKMTFGELRKRSNRGYHDMMEGPPE